MSTYTRWYRDGSVTLTKGSNAVTGTNTYWLTAGLNPGDIFKVDGVDYEIVSITDNTHLTIAGNYAGTTGSDKAYAIVRNFTATMPSKIASQTAELLGDFAKYVDTDMQSIHGKSAYQIACDKGYVGTETEWVASLKGDSAYQVAVANGYTGTVEEWLEALKADNEWSTLDERTNILTWWDNSAIHNSIARGANLGDTFTSAQWNAINNGTFKDLYLGDYWTLPSGKTPFIAGFNYNTTFWDPNLGTITLMVQANGAFNDEETEGNVYAESKWFTDTRVSVIEELEAFFGESRIERYRIVVPVAYSGEAPTTYAVVDSKLHIPPYSMITGISPYHIKNPISWQGTPQPNYWGQLPIFRQGKPTISFMTYVADTSATKWLSIRFKDGKGYAESKSTTNSIYAVFHVGNVGWTYER